MEEVNSDQELINTPDVIVLPEDHVADLGPNPAVPAPEEFIPPVPENEPTGPRVGEPDVQVGDE